MLIEWNYEITRGRSSFKRSLFQYRVRNVYTTTTEIRFPATRSLSSTAQATRMCTALERIRTWLVKASSAINHLSCNRHFNSFICHARSRTSAQMLVVATECINCRSIHAHLKGYVASRIRRFTFKKTLSTSVHLFSEYMFVGGTQTAEGCTQYTETRETSNKYILSSWYSFKEYVNWKHRRNTTKAHLHRFYVYVNDWRFTKMDPRACYQLTTRKGSCDAINGIKFVIDDIYC